MTLNVTSNALAPVDKQDVKNFKSYVFLSSYISRSGGTEEDIHARLGIGLAVYKKLGRI